MWPLCGLQIDQQTGNSSATRLGRRVSTVDTLVPSPPIPVVRCVGEHGRPLKGV